MTMMSESVSRLACYHFKILKRTEFDYNMSGILVQEYRVMVA